MNIANQGFPATRADLNNALQALASNSSGTSAPSTTFANQWWYDTTNNKLYIRNEANNAWIEVAVLDQTNNEWQITTGVIKAKDGDGIVFKTDDDTTRLTLDDSGNFVVGTTGKIGLNSDRLHIGSTEGTDAFIGFGNQIIRPTDSAGASRDAAIDIGYTGMRFRNMYLSGGAYLGGDTAANYLDDYEEGTHAATFGMTTSGSISMLRQNIFYVKVGRIVTVTGEVSVSGVTSPVGSMTMTLPFTISANVTGRDTFMGSKPVAYRVPHSQDNTPSIMGNNAAASVTFLYEQDNAPFADYTPAANATFNLSFSYPTS